MEENQVPNQNPEQFNISGNEKKKKGLGPVKGTLLAIFIVILICLLGLLIRMVVAGDGDFFKPIKSIFGIEDEEENEKKTSKTEKKSSTGKSSFQSAERYALLSDDVEDEDVKHYRLTIDMKEFFSQMMDELGAAGNFENYDDQEYEDDEDYNYDDSEDDDASEDIDWDDEDYSYKQWKENQYDSKLDSENNPFGNMMGMAMTTLSQMADKIDGEIYFDIYFEGSEIVQVVIGYDYGNLLENLYDYALEENDKEFEDKNIQSVDDLADYIVEQFSEYLDEDKLYDMIMENAGDEAESTMKSFGIKEKDIKDMIDFNNERGLLEVYLNGTTKIKGLISMTLDSQEFQNGVKNMEKETGVKFDEDNPIESIINALNNVDEYSEMGLEFVEVK